MPQAATQSPSNTPAATLPEGIEIFRAGARMADDGTVHHISEADLAAAVAAYDPAVHEAPHTVGHPKHNAPAYGWVARLAVKDGSLQIAENKQVEPQFAEIAAAGRVKKRSASFYHPQDPSNPKPGIWYLRHVAWLGAQPPAVKGLKDVNFSEDDAERAVCFSESIPTTPTPSTQESDDMTTEKIKELEAQLQAEKDARAKAETETAKQTQAAEAATAKAASFAEQARAERKAGFVSFAEAEAKAGRLLPKDKAMAVATLEALADAKPVEFAEGDTTTKVSPSTWLQGLISNSKPAVDFGEFAGGNVGQGDQAGQAKGKSDAEIDKAAQEYMRKHKVNYSEAVTAVTTSFTN